MLLFQISDPLAPRESTESFGCEGIREAHPQTFATEGIREAHPQTRSTQARTRIREACATETRPQTRARIRETHPGVPYYEDIETGCIRGVFGGSGVFQETRIAFGPNLGDQSEAL